MKDNNRTQNFKKLPWFRLLQVISLVVSIIILLVGLAFSSKYFPKETPEELIINCKASGKQFKNRDIYIFGDVYSDDLTVKAGQFCAVNYDLDNFIDLVINDSKIKEDAPALYLDKERVEELLSYQNLIPNKSYIKNHFLINERDFMLKNWINPLIQDLPDEWKEFDYEIIKEKEGSWLNAGWKFIAFIIPGLVLQKVIETAFFYVLFGKIMPNFLFSRRLKMGRNTID